MAVGLTYGGGAYIWRRGLHMAEGLTYGGGAYIWRRGLHMAEGLTYGGGAYIWWSGLHMVEWLTYGEEAYIRIPSRQQPIEYILAIYIYIYIYVNIEMDTYQKQCSTFLGRSRDCIQATLTSGSQRLKMNK